MTSKTSHANLGDIIRSEKFAYGYYETELNPEHCRTLVKDKVYVDGSTKSQPMSFDRPGTPWNEPRIKETIDAGAYDNSRGEALFVVERANKQGGGMNYDGPFPDGWYVEARRLKNDGSLDSDGELIAFYQTGCFTFMVPEVELVRKMRVSFVPE